jgi:hypothetical protein
MKEFQKKWRLSIGRLSGSHGRVSAQNIQRRVTTYGSGHFTTAVLAIVDRQARKRIQGLEEQAVQRDREIAGLSMRGDPEARERTLALEEHAIQRDREIAELSARLSHGAADFARLAATVEGIRAFRPLPSQAVCSNPPLLAPSAPSVSAAKAPNAPLATALRPRPTVPPPPQTPRPAPSTVALHTAPAGFASLIVVDFPALFTEFGGKRFTLLWRGSRDGFGARDFHRRCDGHARTLTLIQDKG